MMGPQDVQLTGSVRRAMEIGELQTHIRALATLEETEAPLVTCYVTVGRSGPGASFLEERAREIELVLDDRERALLGEPFERLRRYLRDELQPTTRGVAVFARGGEQPFFLGLQFEVPVLDRLSVGSTPDIYHLVELKDTYHRYVVLISTEESARILEVNLGAATREVWAARPDLRERVGREWTHEHYQDHRRERGERFLKEKIALLEELMSAGGHSHLILAGTPRATARVRAALPRRLLDRLIDVLPAPGRATAADVVSATLSTFIESEQRRSLDAVAELAASLRRSGLAVAGSQGTLVALRRGQADVLVMAREYDGGPAWRCRSCDWVEAMSFRPSSCAECASSEVTRADLREVMVRLAERGSIGVEIVHHSDVLNALGGVGCLLRYASRGGWEEWGG